MLGLISAHRARLHALLDIGVTTFIDLTVPNRENLTDYSAALRRFGSRDLRPVRLHFPIRDAGVPSSTAQLIQIHDAIDAALLNGETVYVHCRAGIGRTGTILGTHLVRHGLSGPAALARISAAWRLDVRSKEFRSCPQTDAQRRLVREWHEAT